MRSPDEYKAGNTFKRAVSEWCKHAADHALEHSSKKWNYLLIPHDAITGNMTLDGLASRFQA